ncbi:AAA family ATPase [Streptomyces sp. NPDC058221]|uniref:AAA family ATPase n=1 Tax=Streptomyces sp. NPDC058221 TaxID=3346388 RepID=UPI0036F01C1E
MFHPVPSSSPCAETATTHDDLHSDAGCDPRGATPATQPEQDGAAWETLSERADPLAKLMKSFAGTRADAGQIVQVSGPVASGKTELLRVFTAHARQKGALVLHATARAIEGELPQGVLKQLVESLPSEFVRRADGAHAECSTETNGDHSGSESPAQDPAETTQFLHKTLLKISRHKPIVICVDDVQYADTASLDILMSLLQGWRGARILTVLAVRTGEAAENLALYRLPWDREVTRIRLSMLSPDGTRSLLTRSLGPSAGGQLAPTWYAMTGGNPVLLNALAQNAPSSGLTDAAGAQEAHDHEAFRLAVMRCLWRAGTVVMHCAQALATLDRVATPLLLAGLLGISPQTVLRALAELAGMGFLDGGRLRSPGIRQSVRNGVPATARCRLQLRAARILYNDGADVEAIAPLIEAAGGSSEDWAVRSLLETAQRYTQGSLSDRRIRYLRLAQRAGADGPQAERVTLALTEALWQTDPALAFRYAAELATPERRANLPSGAEPLLAKCLLWGGEVDEAAALFSSAAPDTASDAFNQVRVWFSYLYPGFDPSTAAGPRRSRRHADAEPDGAGRYTTGASLPPESGQCHPDKAGERLSSVQLTEGSLPHVAIALAELLAAGRTREARRSADRLLEQAAASRVPLWTAILTACRAEIALREERPAEAERLARLAIDEITEPGWGIALAGPLSTLITALVEQGRTDEAAPLVAKTLASHTFRGSAGPGYLAARGRYHLAVDEPRLALLDFERCGELLRTWSVELPLLSDWRVGVGEAQLRLDRPHDARRTLRAHLRQSDGRHPWIDGQIRHLLAEATAVVRRASSHRTTGEPEGDPRLSKAELRVVTLASAGLSNRDIAGELFITVSTVEQHLTRVYRKLGIAGRAELVEQARAWKEEGPP